MLSLSQTTAYAIMALATIANREVSLFLPEIANEQGFQSPISPADLSDGDSGLIHTKRGYKEG